MKAFFLAALAAFVSADASDFPTHNSGHAHCELDSPWSNTSCDTLWEEIDAQVRVYGSGDAAGGVYSVYEEEDPEYVWATRRTGGKAKYVDDVIYELTQSGTTCDVRGRSRSQSMSYIDYDTNYCNIWNVYNSVGGYSDLYTTGDCPFIPDDAATQCDLY